MTPSNPIDAVTHRDPYGFYRSLAVDCPVYRDDALGLWIVSGAAAVTSILESETCRVRPVAEPVPCALRESAAGEIFRHLVRTTDGTGHTAMKRTVTRALAGVDAVVVAREARAWLEHRLTDAGEALCEGTLNDVIFELPVAVVAALLGVPGHVVPELTATIGDFARVIAPGRPADEVAKGKVAASALLSLFGTLRPDAGLLGRLYEEAGQCRSDAVLANAIGFLSQTYEATAGLVGNALLTAAAQRDAFQRAVDRACMSDFVREVLRYDPPIHNTRRYFAEDVTIDGRTIRAGETALVLLAAANHDSAVNPEPHRFDPDRADLRTFTFGLGRHACPGETIATATAAVAVEMLVPRLTDLESLAAGVAYRPSPNARIPVFGGSMHNDTGGLAQ